MTTILSVFGTRPEAIKMAPVVKQLAMHSDVTSRVCVTGQHRQMLDQVLEFFGIVPDYDLEIMRPGQSLTEVTSAVLSRMESVLRQLKPDWVLVHGDTTTAMAAAMAAFYQRIPVAHVEAGLRTGDLTQPWPEEMNRKVIDSIGDVLFAPTAQARNNLLNEGLGGRRILVTGNTVVDALLYASHRLDTDPELTGLMRSRFGFLSSGKKTVLVTGHRRENFGDGFKRICQALGEIAANPDVQIVYPVHLNPNVKGPVEEILGGKSGIFLIEPQAYLEFVYLMKRADLILTDSGGVQEEAPSLGKTILIMRDTTERPEIIDCGAAFLVGTSVRTIVDKSLEILNGTGPSKAPRQNPYGDGLAGARIVASLLGKESPPPFEAGL